MQKSTDGAYRIVAPPLERRLAMESFAALPSSHPIVALLELDVTTAQDAIAAQQRAGVRVSLFAFLVRSIAVALAEHPELRWMRHRHRLVCFEDVDVSIPVEVYGAHGHFPREVVVRRAQALSAAAIYAQLERAREREQQEGVLGPEDRWSRRMMGLLHLVPAPLRRWYMRRLMGDAFAVKRRAGTTLVTSVGKFADIPGFALTFTTGPRATTFAVGSVVDKPWLHGGKIAIRSILGFAIVLNHDLVDGAPGARFARRLQQLVESADGLS